MNNNQTVIPSVKAKITWMNDDTSAPKKASASITIGNSFMVNGLSIVQGQKGLFVSMPQRVSEKDGQKKYVEVAHPINSEMRTAINNAVLNSYSQTLALSQQFRSGDQMQIIHTLMLDELPKGSYIKSGYFLIEDVERYMHTGDPDSFYDRKEPAVFAAILQNEAVLGAPPTKYDLEGNPYPIRSAADYMYFAYPDYQSEAYEAFLIRQFAEALERYPDIEFDSIIVLETEG